MPYTINYTIYEDFLKVELEGSYPLNKFKEISNDIDKALAEYNLSKTLVDLRKFVGRFGVFDGVRHIENFPEESRYRKFAILDLEYNKHNNDFFENASYNRGFSVLFFYDEAKALKWLEVGTPENAGKTVVKEI